MLCHHIMGIPREATINHRSMAFIVECVLDSSSNNETSASFFFVLVLLFICYRLPQESVFFYHFFITPYEFVFFLITFFHTLGICLEQLMISYSIHFILIFVVLDLDTHIKKIFNFIYLLNKNIIINTHTHILINTKID